MACARHLNAGFEAMQRAAGDRMFFQAEFVHPDGLEAASSVFQSGREEGFAVVFEAVPLYAWRGQIISRPLVERRRILEALHATARPTDIGLALHSQGYDAEGIELAAGCAWDAGEEGLVVKNLMSPFVRGRSRAWMKVKAQMTVDLPIQSARVIGGRLEAIVVTYKGKPIVVPVGFSEDQRRLPSYFTAGRMVEIKHNGETRGGFLKGATFLRFRDDKGGSGGG
jgi:ATP-dependent DNA ligase